MFAPMLGLYIICCWEVFLLGNYS